MEEEKIENGDSQNAEVEVETTEETTETETEADKEDKADKAEAEVKDEDLSEREKQFLARAKKAEGKLKEFKTKIKETSESKPEATDKSKEDDKDERLFFLENPELKAHKELIQQFKQPGKSYEEVLKNPVIKKTLDDLKALKESQASKSVIHNNSRIATEDAGEKKAFEEARKTGKWSEYITKYRTSK